MNKELTRSRSRDRLVNTINETIINDGAKKILDFAEVAIGDSGCFKSYRAKVLRVLNDVTRKLQIEIKNHYIVEYDSNMESVMVIGKGEGQ